MRDPMPFLLARLAEDDDLMDELSAHVETLPVLDDRPSGTAGLVLVDDDDPSGANRYVVVSPELTKSFLRRCGPWRLEQDVESRRRAASEHQEGGGGACATCGVVYPCNTLVLLTWVYSDHPTFDPEWHGREDESAARARAIARERLDWIATDRSVAELLAQDVPEDEISARLGLTLSRVRRTRGYLHRLGGLVPETPEEVIVRCVVDGSDRAAMVERLKTWQYTFGVSAPPSAEGGTTGSWDDVEDALFDGLLTRDEYDAVRAAVDAAGGTAE